MRKFLIIAFLFVLNNVFVPAQSKIAQLHPIIGDTISQSEKRLFLLFSQIPDSTYHFGQLMFDDKEGYMLISTMNNADVLKQEIDREEVEQYKANVDKLLAYYAQIDTSSVISDKNDLGLSLMSLNSNPVNKDALQLSSEQKKILVKNAIRYNYLKMEGIDNGLWGQDLDNYIKTSGSWDFPILGLMLKSAITKKDPFIDEVIYRMK